MPKRRKSKRRLSYNFYRSTGFPRLNPAQLLLEQISDSDLAKSRSRAAALQAYHKQFFYELEGQRAAHADAIRAALQSIPGLTISVNDWCRQVRAIYALSPLSCKGSLKLSGRFNFGEDLDNRFPRFPALYLGESRAVAHCEMFQIQADGGGKLSVDDLNFQPPSSIAVYVVEGTVNQIFDLTDVSNLVPLLEVTKGFSLSSQVRKLEEGLGLGKGSVAQLPEQLMSTIMDPNWRSYVMYADLPANSQVLGALLQDAGFEGVVYPSMRSLGGKALALFPRSLKSSTSIVRVRGYPPGATCVEASAITYKNLE